MNNTLSLSSLIDTNEFPLQDILKGEKLWDPIKNLKDFINDCFAKGIIKPNYKDSKNIYIGEGTKILESALILGPAIIGKNCIIGHASFIRENCLLGDDVTIGHATEIKNSIFLNKSVAAHLNYVGDSIIGNNVNIAGGVIIANYRLDKKTVRVNLGSENVDSELLKLGAIIGDNSNIGTNSVLNPGTILGKNTLVYPLSSVTGTHNEGEIIKGLA